MNLNWWKKESGQRAMVLLYWGESGMKNNILTRTFVTMLLSLVGALPAYAVAPPPPQGGVLTTSTVTNNTAVAIPTGPAVVTSTVSVSGAGPYLWDVDLTTLLQHTFSNDLDVTIQSPAGTIVTLTTDNGGSNDDVFNGTLWDDQAGDTVTDHVYANLTTASPLSPEEALGAFRGENPNGTWTITISDDAGGDGGSLNSWTLDIYTLPGAPVTSTTSFSNDTVTPIPDPGTTTSTIVVSGKGSTITDLSLLTNLQHTFSADLDITLTSPSGTVVTLTTDNGGSNDNVFDGTTWADNANPAGQVPYTTNDGLVTDQAYVNLTLASPLVPEEPLSAFLGEDPNGTWTITITDDTGSDVGTLNSWVLNVTTGAMQVTPAHVSIPALNTWGMAILVSLLALGTVITLRRNRL